MVSFCRYFIPAAGVAMILAAALGMALIEKGWRATVITGSFNFTKAAQERNAENVLIIHDRELAARYAANWRARKAVSRPIQ